MLLGYFHLCMSKIVRSYKIYWFIQKCTEILPLPLEFSSQYFMIWTEEEQQIEKEINFHSTSLDFKDML